VFVFEGDGARRAVEQLLGDARVWKAAAAWKEVIAVRPRLAENVFTWPPP
jgi:hypothetical protein